MIYPEQILVQLNVQVHEQLLKKEKKKKKEKSSCTPNFDKGEDN